MVDEAPAADRSELERQLFAYNAERTGYTDGRDLSCFLRGSDGELVAAAETEARARGCETIVVSSHEFQAPGFYEHLGSEPVGATVDTPLGFRELTYQKRLEAGA